MWKRYDSGVIEYQCAKCGRVFDISSEWERVNLDWHEHN